MGAYYASYSLISGSGPKGSLALIPRPPLCISALQARFSNLSGCPKVISCEVMSPETRVKYPEKRSHVARILTGEVRKEVKLIFLNKECVLIYHSLSHNGHSETKQAV